jgi:hypothetical protein
MKINQRYITNNGVIFCTVSAELNKKKGFYAIHYGSNTENVSVIVPQDGVKKNGLRGHIANAITPVEEGKELDRRQKRLRILLEALETGVKGEYNEPRPLPLDDLAIWLEGEREQGNDSDQGVYLCDGIYM